MTSRHNLKEPTSQHNFSTSQIIELFCRHVDLSGALSTCQKNGSGGIIVSTLVSSLCRLITYVIN